MAFDLLSAFKEAYGKTSFSRVSSTVVLIFWLAWVSYIVFLTKSLPSGMWEISTVIGALYSMNKVTEVISGKTCDDKDKS